MSHGQSELELGILEFEIDQIWLLGCHIQQSVCSYFH